MKDTRNMQFDEDFGKWLLIVPTAMFIGLTVVLLIGHFLF